MKIGARFNGPAESGNGGYSAGLFAAAFPEWAAPEVTLHAPPPLETSMYRRDRGIFADDELIATVTSASPRDGAVPPVLLSEAIDAAETYPGFNDHPFPSCFVCGPNRAEGDGLRIFPGPVGDGRTASPWTAPPDVDELIVWAALDCPGGWSIISPGRPYVLGRMTASIAALPEPGDECVVVGACLQVEGRKALTNTALYGPDGALLGTGRATWIAI